MVQVPVLAIHGGAGTINREALSAEAEREYRGALQSILEKGRDALAAGASALDAVTLAVSMLEDCPLFNAGRGAVYTSAETHYQIVAQAYQLTAGESKALLDAVSMMKPIAWASMFMITDLVAGAVLSPIIAAVMAKKDKQQHTK